MTKPTNPDLERAVGDCLGRHVLAHWGGDPTVQDFLDELGERGYTVVPADPSGTRSREAAAAFSG
jgi:hypothetical protein